MIAASGCNSSEGRELQTYFAGNHTSDVQKIVDQPRHTLDLTRENASCVLCCLVARARNVQHLRSSRLRAERVAQFMPKHREELILCLVGGVEFFLAFVKAMRRGEESTTDVAHLAQGASIGGQTRAPQPIALAEDASARAIHD
jgi:hypothetical protein